MKRALSFSLMLPFLLVALIVSTNSAAGQDAPSNSATKTKKPNVILIMADDLGYAELGCYGQKIIKTPNIDSIAKEGIRFTQFYCGSPVCAPSRSVLLTGKHPGHAYVRANGNPRGMKDLRKEKGWEFPGQNPIPESEFTLGELFQAKGYKTAAIGKWGTRAFWNIG